MKRTKVCLFILTVFLLGCSPQREYVMPFVNFEYDGGRLFPIVKSDADFGFRAWVSLSSSIDRVFTVSYNKDLGYKGKTLEIRNFNLSKKGKDKTTYREDNFIPESGFEGFIRKADSLNLIDLKDQLDSNFSAAIHEPVGLFIIEIKRHGQTNIFKFRAHVTNSEKVEDKYQQVYTFIVKEFPFKFYFDK